MLRPRPESCSESLLSGRSFGWHCRCRCRPDYHRHRSPKQLLPKSPCFGRWGWKSGRCKASRCHGSILASFSESPVGKCVVNRLLVRKGDYPQNPTLQFLNLTPKTISVVFLRFNSDRVLNDPDAPLLLK